MHTLELNYRGVSLDVHYEYNPADDGGREYPSSPEDYAVYNAFVEGVDITELLSKEHLDALAERIKEEASASPY